MKILRLRLTNLNSLRGDTAIDFTIPPLANSGLFAITGPTGAGKTTILDAITLALYGRVARYGTEPSPEAMMSRHTGECSAEVEFSCAAGTFRSVWQLQRARKAPGGKIQQAKRRVISLPAESPIAESIKDSDQKIQELTGLDYDRFLRSVLLAQGEFATFLKAGPKDRTELLQKVTGTAIYQDISQAAFRRAADAEQAHDNLRRDHQAVPVLDAEQRSLHEATLAEHTRRLAELAGIIKTISSRIAHAERWLELEKSAGQLAKDKNDHAESMRQAASELNRLDRHEKAAPSIATLIALDRLISDHAKDTTALAELNTKLPELVRLLQSAEDAAEGAQSTLTTEESRQDQLRLLWTEVTEIDKTLATAREGLRQANEQHGGCEKSVATLAASLAKENATHQEISAGHATTVTWLAENVVNANISLHLPEIQATSARWLAAENSLTEAQKACTERLKEVGQLLETIRTQEILLPPLQHDAEIKSAVVDAANRALSSASEQLSLNEIETLRDQAREQRTALEKLGTEAARLRTLIADRSARQKEQTLNATELVESAEASNNRQARFDDLAKLLASRREVLTYAEKVRSLESHRTVLQDNAPCPLCGAVHHPYAVHTPTDDLVTVRRNVETAEVELKDAQGQLTTAEKHRAALLADERRLSADCAKLAAEHAALETAWNTAATPHQLSEQFENDTALTIKLSTSQTEETRRNNQITAVRAAQLALEQAKTAQQVARSAVDRIQVEVAKQVAVSAQIQAQVPALEAALAEHRQNATDEKNTFIHIVADFADAPSVVGEVPAFLEKLKTRGATYSRQKTAAQSLHTDLKAQKAKVDAIAEQLTTVTTAVIEARAKVAAAQGTFDQCETVRREKFGSRSVVEAQQEAETLLKQKRKAAEATRADTEKLRQNHTATTQEKDRLIRALAERTTERTTTSEQFHVAATQAGFADETELRTALLPAADATAVAAQRKTLEERRITLASQTATLATQRAALPLTACDDAPQLGVLQTKHAADEAEASTLQGTAGEIRAILKNDTDQRARQASFAQQIEAAHRDYVRWDKLRALIGSADGSLFARFAQSLTLERLTILANRQLTQLNPRYAIRRAADGEAGDLDLEIIDHYQADVSRPMRSLSGGESFLVSLALALGLSELASGHTSIESLFIDEGFGSLDPETLETAMSALENLQAGGKTIGVISHVPAMQERITSQIKVIKESNGCSRIELSV